MIRLTMLCVIAMGVLIVGAGCQSTPWQRDTMPPVELLEDDPSPSYTEEGTVAPKQPGGLQMAPNQRFRDVPLPANAKEDLERSYVYETPEFKVGRMVYTIRESVNDIAQFYIDACPAADWRLINVKQADGGAELLFRKAGKKLEVSIIPLGLFRGRRLVLHLVPDQTTESDF